MKKLLKIITVTALLAFTATACNHQGKEETISQNAPTQDVLPDDTITKQTYTDEYGDQLEVVINETKNTVMVRFEGKNYELKKSEELPDYTAADAFYQYSDVRGEVTFLNKDYNMVMFHHKREKKTSGTKMASF